MFNSQTRNLRRTTMSHAMQMRQMMADTIVKIGTLAASFCEEDPESVSIFYQIFCLDLEQWLLIS